jgi:hypothetical protein
MDGISAYDALSRGSTNNNGASTGGKTPRGSAKAALDKQVSPSGIPPCFTQTHTRGIDYTRGIEATGDTLWCRL